MSPSKGNNELPLSGCRILVSRARKQADTLSSALHELGATVIAIPFIEIRKPKSFEPLDEALINLCNYDWLILTSVNGVDAMFARMAKLRLGHDELRRLKIAAIGPATKKAIEREGLEVAVTPNEYVAESVVDSLRTKVKSKRVLLVRAKIARDVIPSDLRKSGATVDVVEAYETVVPKSSATRLHSALAKKSKPHAITFTSSSTVKNFVALLGLRKARAALKKPSVHHGVHSASLGPVTSATLREFGLPVDIEAAEYTIPGLVAAILAQKARIVNEA